MNVFLNFLLSTASIYHQLKTLMLRQDMREAPFLPSYAVTSFQKYYSIFIGLNISDGDDIELYKEGDYTEGLMPEYLRKLLQLGKLSNSQLDILCNLSLLPLLAHIHPCSRIILLICFAVIITLSVFCKSTSAACEIPGTWLARYGFRVTKNHLVNGGFP